MNPTTTSPPSKTTHHRNLATSSFEPTIKKHPKSPNIKSIIKPLKNLYTSHQNTFKPPSYGNNYVPKPQFEEKSMSKSSQQSGKTTLEIEKQIVVKSSGFLSRTRTETTYKAKPISISSIQDKPMSKSIHQSRKSSLEIEKQKLRASVTGVFYKDSTFSPKPAKEASFESKPMSKTTHQSRKSNVEIEKHKLRSSLNGVYDKDSTFSTKPVKETSFHSNPVFVSLIEDKPMSRTTHQSRKSNVEIEKQKLRASINGGVNKPRDFKVESIEELNVSLSKSQDSGLKAVYRSEGIDLKRPSFTLATGGRRRSFCNSQAELDDFLRCNGVKIVSVDMPPFMQIHAVDCARKTCDSLEKFTSKTLALTLKKEFDGVYGPAWHCIVGSSFGSFVTHSIGGFMYFSMDHKIYVLLFKTTVQRAN